MPHQFTASRAITAFDQDCTLIVVIEMSQSTWIVTGLLPGVERQPLKKLEHVRLNPVHILRLRSSLHIRSD